MEEVDENKAQVPDTLARFLVKVKGLFFDLENRLGTLTKRQLTVLLGTVGLGALFLGVLLGSLLIASQPTQPPENNGNSSPNNSQPQTVSETGVLRMFQTPQNGIEFYLGKQEGGRILLDFGDRFDSSFLKANYEGAAVTVEGKLRKSSNDSKDILRVEKIIIKH
jgi:hypothetical protein